MYQGKQLKLSSVKVVCILLPWPKATSRKKVKLLSISLGEGREDMQAGIWSRNHRGMLLSSLLECFMLAFIYSPGSCAHVVAHMRLGPPASADKTMPHRLDHRPTWSDLSFQWNSLLRWFYAGSSWKLKLTRTVSILVMFLLNHKSNVSKERFVVAHGSENLSPSEQRKHGSGRGLVHCAYQKAEKGEQQCSDGCNPQSLLGMESQPVERHCTHSVNSLWKQPHRHTQGCASLMVFLDPIELTMGINHHNVKINLVNSSWSEMGYSLGKFWIAYTGG